MNYAASIDIPSRQSLPVQSFFTYQQYMVNHESRVISNLIIKYLEL